MQVNLLKNKVSSFLVAFIFALVGCFTLTTSKVSAGLDDSAFWGITVNFQARVFEGYVIDDTNGKYTEKFHSLFYCNDDKVPLSEIKAGTTNKGAPWYNPLIPMTQSGKNGSCDGTTNLEYGISANKVKLSEINNLTNENDILDTLSNIRSGESFSNLVSDGWAGNASFGSLNHQASTWRKINAVYTWPGTDNAGDITEQEKTYMAKMSSTLTNSFNETLALLLNNNQKDFPTITDNTLKMYFLDFSVQVARDINKDGTHTISNKYFDINWKSEAVTSEEFKKTSYSKIAGINESYLRKVTVKDSKGNEEKLIVIWKYPKGYASGQELYSIVVAREGKDVFKDSEEIGGYTKNLSWSHIVYQALFNFYTSGTDSLGAADLYEADDGLIATMLTSLINTIVNGLNNFLGLYSLEELTLNTGARQINYWNGIFPAKWFSAAQYFYLFSLTIAVLMLMISLIKLAGAKAASTVGNVAKRISLIEGTKRVIVCAGCAMLFVPIFTILVEMNNLITEALKGLIPEGLTLNFTAAGTSGMGLAGAIISIMAFYVTLKMNFTYILRAITVLICYILGPMAIMCSALGDKFAQITSNWLKELIGNIFIQSIHALIMMVYINVAGAGAIASIEKLVIFYSFIPLTEFVRTNIFNLGSGLNHVADNLNDQVGNVAGGVVSAAASGALLKSKGVIGGKGGNNGGNGSGVGLKDKSSGLNNSSEEGLVKGKPGILDKTSSSISGAYSNSKFGQSKVGQSLATVGKFGARTGLNLAAVGGASAMALGSGAANSQGRASVGATRAVGMAAAAAGLSIGMGYSDMKNEVEGAWTDDGKTFDDIRHDTGLDFANRVQLEDGKEFVPFDSSLQPQMKDNLVGQNKVQMDIGGQNVTVLNRNGNYGIISANGKNGATDMPTFHRAGTKNGKELVTVDNKETYNNYKNFGNKISSQAGVMKSQRDAQRVQSRTSHSQTISNSQTIKQK